MGDDSRGSFKQSLKNEWNLLWESLAGEKEDDKKADAFESGDVEVLTLTQLKAITKALSEDRKKLNQKLEKLNKEIDLNTAKLESLRLVGSPAENTLNRVVELTDMGHSTSETLQKLDMKLRMAHQLEEEILREQTS